MPEILMKYSKYSNGSLILKIDMESAVLLLSFEKKFFQTFFVKSGKA